MIAADDFADALKHLARAVAAHPAENWRDATSDGQLRSKLWLVETLRNLDVRLGDTLVVGGWLGFLPMLLRTVLADRCGRVAMIDLDDDACRAADALLRAHAMRDLAAFAGRADAFAIDYAAARFDRVREDGSRQPIRFRPSTIINTSWEHFGEPERWFYGLPAGRLVAVQANKCPDYDGHNACPADLAALEAATPFAARLFSGVRRISGYERLMTIGLR